MDQQVSMPTVSMGGSYDPSNHAASGLPPWTSTSSGEDYEGLRALYAPQQRMPAMIQHSRYPNYPADPTVMTTSRKKSPVTKTRKQKSQISANNAHTSIRCAQGDATTMPMYNIPNSIANGFVMPDIDGSLTMPHQPITTVHSPYLPTLPHSSMPQDHSQVVPAHLVAQHPSGTQQPLSHIVTHPSLVVTSAATSVALPISAPTQLLTQGWGGHSGCSGTSTIHDQWTPLDLNDLPVLTEADLELYIPQVHADSTSGQKAQAAQPEVEQIQKAQHPQGAEVLSQNNILASTNQAPPQVAGNSCQNISEEHSSPIATLDHEHLDTDGSNLTTVGVPTTQSLSQGYVTSNSSIITQKSDQLPACASPNHNQSDLSTRDDDAQVCYSPTMSDSEIIEKMESDLRIHMCLKSSHQYFRRKRTSTTAGLESENEDENTHTHKNARKDSGGDDSNSEHVVPFVLLKMYEQMKNMNEQLHDIRTLLSGPRSSQQVKKKGSIKTEAQNNNYMIHALPALKEESNGIRVEDCYWEGENLLKIEGDDPLQFGRNLLEKLFSVNEMVGKCYKRGPRMSKKPLLDQERVKIIDDCLMYRFGPECFSDELTKNLNQKCRDIMKRVNKK